MRYVDRAAESRLRELLRTFPAVLVLGPRQCGKSTLVRHVCSTWQHLDLERPSDLSVLTSDLEGFLERNPSRVTIDEAQNYPDLFPALRHQLDNRPRPGSFVLTGSASPTLVRRVSETLAGRIAVLELAPFSSSELIASRRSAARWFWGGYPPIHARRPTRARLQWLDAYVATFLERDLPAFGVRLPAARLRTLWTMLTHVHGSVLNVADLGRSLGVSSHTVDGDLDVLEQTFMIRRLRPYYANVQKRLTKSAKLFIRDTGLLHFLAGLREPRELDTWSRRGASFEGLVIEELIGRARSNDVGVDAFYWRTHAGAEVDLLLVRGRQITPIEIKLGAAVDARSLAGLRQCMADLGLKRGFVVYGGNEHRSVGAIDLVPWGAAVTGSIDLPF
jgi:hypothetical protein